jgi:hypothetical protein
MHTQIEAKNKFGVFGFVSFFFVALICDVAPELSFFLLQKILIFL